MRVHPLTQFAWTWLLVCAIPVGRQVTEPEAMIGFVLALAGILIGIETKPAHKED